MPSGGLNRETPDAWSHRLLTVVDVIKRTKSKGKKTKGLYKGELIKKHGEDEAEDFIWKGKYRCEPDDDGDMVYYKTQKYFDESEHLTETATLSMPACFTKWKIILIRLSKG